MQYVPQIKYVAQKIGSKGVAELERLATALYVTIDQGKGVSPSERLKELITLKSHIRNDDGMVAIREIDNMINEYSASI